MPHKWVRVSDPEGTMINRRRYWECRNCGEITKCLEGIPDPSLRVPSYTTPDETGHAIYMTCEEVQVRNVHAS